MSHSNRPSYIRRTVRLASLLTLALLTGASGAEAQREAPRITAEVSTRRVPSDRPVRLTIVVEGEGAETAAIAGRAPEGSRLTPVGSFSRSTSSRMTWVGGQVESRVSTRFSIDYVPSAAGVGRIPSIEVSIGEETFRTDPIDVEIVKAGTDSAGDSDGRPDARMLARLSRDRIYVGEETVLEYVLRTRVRVTGFDPQRLEQLSGFIVDDENVDPRDTEKTVTGDDGAPWTEYVLFRRRLIPTRTGTLSADPIAFRLGVAVRERDLFRSPFGRSETIVRIAPQVIIEVLPLPEEGRPDSFSGAVGSFSLDAKIGTDRVVAGESLDLVVTVAGEGSLATAEAPEVMAPPDVQVFAPRELESAAGGRTWVFPLVPRAAGNVRVDGVRFSYFDSRDDEYRELAQGPFDVEVAAVPEGSARSGAALASGPTPIEAEGSDLRYLKALPDRLGAGPLASGSSPLFVTLAGAPLVLVAGIWMLARLRARLATSPRAIRLRVEREIRSAVRHARKRAATEPDAAAHEVVAVLHKWAEAAIGRSAKPLQRSELRRSIESATGSKGSAETFLELLDRAEAARYAGSFAGESVVGLVDEVASFVAAREGAR